MTIPEIDFPTSDSDFIKDPYPFMKELRAVSYTHLRAHET